MPINWFCTNYSSQVGNPIFDTSTDKIHCPYRKIMQIENSQDDTMKCPIVSIMREPKYCIKDKRYF